MSMFLKTVPDPQHVTGCSLAHLDHTGPITTYWQAGPEQPLISFFFQTNYSLQSVVTLLINVLQIKNPLTLLQCIRLSLASRMPGLGLASNMLSLNPSLGYSLLNCHVNHCTIFHIICRPFRDSLHCHDLCFLFWIFRW